MMFSVLSANAVDVIRYNNAGVPISISRNLGRPVNVSHMSYYSRARLRPGMSHPAGFARPIYPPERRYRYDCRRRPPMPPDRMGNHNFMPMPSAVVPTRTTISRLNKNSSANVPKSSHTINGVTYYD